MKYTKQTGVQGAWVKSSEVEDGIKAKLVSESKPIEGEYGTQDIAKIRFQGEEEDSKNVRLNKTTINGLIDAFGDESKNWVNQVLTARTEKAQVAGKRVTILYLIPEGYGLSEDSNGYVIITKVGGEKTVEYPEDEINLEGIPPGDIPF
jgi:hypothetical protein|tara:strand:- start:2642 stop:3088 length:447 start_codon:yes stop_codon:yes gene_type:complete